MRDGCSARWRRGSALLIAVALAAAGLATSTASAQGPTLELSNEATGSHCDFVMAPGEGGPTDVEGGCLIHASANTVEIRKHVFGIESHIGLCNGEVQGRINENGEGYLLEQVITDTPLMLCTRRPCSLEGERVPWPVQAEEGATSEQGNSKYLLVEICIGQILGGGEETCDIKIPFEQIPMAHYYELGHSSEIPGESTGGFRCELVTHWYTETGGTHDGEAEQEITITHLAR